MSSATNWWGWSDCSVLLAGCDQLCCFKLLSLLLLSEQHTLKYQVF
uniref:Uncharacterized protein n=1 Tax=Rheinheimera sp. BAL341 TaxID=1708203 RepID=A0A486XR28_9GAMM